MSRLQLIFECNVCLTVHKITQSADETKGEFLYRANYPTMRCTAENNAHKCLGTAQMIGTILIADKAADV
jgi:hypothetical protein